MKTYTWKTAARKIRIDPIIENAMLMFGIMAHDRRGIREA